MDWKQFTSDALKIVSRALPKCHLCGGAGTQPCSICGEVACHRHAFTNVGRLLSICDTCVEEKFPELRDLPEDWPYEEYPWEILGIDAEATEAEVRAAQKKMSKEHHPDKGGDPEMMTAVNRAVQEMLK